MRQKIFKGKKIGQKKRIVQTPHPKKQIGMSDPSLKKSFNVSSLKKTFWSPKKKIEDHDHPFIKRFKDVMTYYSETKN